MLESRKGYRGARGRLLILAAIVTGLSLAPRGNAAETETADWTAPRDYVVFMGIDVFADADNQQQLLPVVGGSERKVVVQGDNGTSVVPRKDVVFSGALEPKVSRGAVTIEALDGQPIHSSFTDPMANVHRQMMDIYSVDANRQEMAQGAARQAEITAMAAGQANAMTPDDAPNKGATEALAAAAGVQAAAAVGMAADTIANSLYGDMMPGGVVENGMFDGFQVTFRISAPERHSNAYGVLQMMLRDPWRPELGAQHAFQIFRMPALEPRPKKVIVRRFSLPLGFTVDSYEVFVYADSGELATNRSRNRVAVTEAEALQFLILRHMQRNKGVSQEPQVAVEMRPEWPRTELARDWENILVTLRITSEGTVEESNVAGGISSPLTEELASAVMKVRFLPALFIGEPTPSMGSFALGELFQPPAHQL